MDTAPSILIHHHSIVEITPDFVQRWYLYRKRSEKSNRMHVSISEHVNNLYEVNKTLQIIETSQIFILKTGNIQYLTSVFAS